MPVNNDYCNCILSEYGFFSINLRTKRSERFGYVNSTPFFFFCARACCNLSWEFFFLTLHNTFGENDRKTYYRVVATDVRSPTIRSTPPPPPDEADQSGKCQSKRYYVGKRRTPFELQQIEEINIFSMRVEKGRCRTRDSRISAVHCPTSFSARRAYYNNNNND